MDDLKPFGMAIDGCIDGFSRPVVWTEATNRTPTLYRGSDDKYV